MLSHLHLQDGMSVGIHGLLRFGLDFLPRFIDSVTRSLRIRAGQKMLELLAIRTQVFTIKSRFRRAPDSEHHRAACRLEMSGARADVNGCNAACEYRAHNRAGHNVLLRFEEGLYHSMYGGASRHAARHLRNYDARELQLRMASAVPHQHLRHLLRRGDAHVSDDAAMQGFRVVKVHNIFGEVGAVPAHSAEV